MSHPPLEERIAALARRATGLTPGAGIGPARRPDIVPQPAGHQGAARSAAAGSSPPPTARPSRSTSARFIAADAAGRAAGLRPRSVAAAGALLRANERIGVVPQGGNTSYCGGATPHPGNSEIVVSLRRMNRIRSVDAGERLDDRRGRLRAGRRCSRRPPRPTGCCRCRSGSEGTCTLGGVISTNAGGTAVLRYGMMRELVLGLEVVLPGRPRARPAPDTAQGQHGLRPEAAVHRRRRARSAS